MRRLTLLVSVLLLFGLAPAAATAQDSDTEGQQDGAVLSESDVAFLQELTRQERAAIADEMSRLQEGIDDPATIAVWTSRGPVIVPIRRLPSIMQMISVGAGHEGDVTLEQLALWLRLDTRVELLPSARYLSANQVRELRDLVVAANEAAERKLDALFDLKQAADRFEAWLGEQPVGPEPDDQLAAGPGDGYGVDTGFAAAEGPHTGSCVFTSGYLLLQDDYPVTQVVAWRKPDFDPEQARYHYASAALDEEADDPGHRIERMRANVAAEEDAIVVFDGSFSGFCRWAAATCPNTSPKQGGTPVCIDGAPNDE